MVLKGVIVVFHVTVIVNYVLYLIHQSNVSEDLNLVYPDRARFGGSFKYLTNWNVWLQAMYFIIALANDIFGSEARTKERSSATQKIRDFMLHLKLRRLKDLTSICTKWKFETFRGYVVVYYTSRNDEECSVRFNYSKLKS